MMGCLKLLPLVLAAVAFSACSQNPVAVPLQAAQPQRAARLAENAQAEPSKLAPVVPTLPKQQLTGEVLFEFLVSEIAGQRGMLGVAKEGYLDLAKKTQDPRIAERAAEIAIFSRDQAAALEATKLWVKLDPDAPRANQAMAALLIDQGQIDAAEPYLASYLKEEEGQPTVFLRLPVMFAKVKDTDKALDIIKKLMRDYPQSAEAHYALAQTAAHAHQMDVAMDELAQADRLRPGWEPAALMRAQLLAHRSPADSLAFLKEFLGGHPQARDVRLAYARLLVSTNQYAAAREQFNELMVELPDNPDIALASGLLALQMSDLNEAERLLLRARELNYKEPETTSYYLGQIAEERAQYDRAQEYYRSVNEGEFLIPARSRQAGILAREGKLAEARTLLTQTPAVNDAQRIELSEAEAGLLRDARDYEGVYKVLSDALGKFPDDLDLLYDRAMAAERIDKLDVMEQDLRKVIRIKPDYAHAYNALGYTLADRTDRLAEAEDLLNKALSLAPDDPFILDSMGWLLYRKGNLNKAQEFLDRAYKNRPDPEIAAHLGEVLWMKGAKDEADKVWHASLQNNPQNEALIDVLKKFNKR
jgi:tetratricopeptide (TPR) repeat protein